MKPQEIKFTFVYNEIKQCRKHFTGISDFCSNIAFTYVFSLQGLAAKSSETACGARPKPGASGPHAPQGIFCCTWRLVRLEYGPGLAYLTMAAFNSALVLMAASVVFSCSVSLWKCSVASVAFCSNCPYSISPLLQIGKGGGHLFQIENFGPPLISRPLARL